MLKIKRVYEESAKDDGFRILIGRLWPRGLTKEKAKVGLWLKDIAPSDSLRKWFSHDPKKWAEFKSRYLKELKDKKELLDLILSEAKKGVVTLLYGVKEEGFNNAVALEGIFSDQDKKLKL